MVMGPSQSVAGNGAQGDSMKTHNGAVDAAAADSDPDVVGREASRKELMTECRRLVADAEALMHRAANLSGEALMLARGEVDQRLMLLRERYDALATEATRRGKHARDVTDRYVRDNPWRSVGAAAAIGAVVGVLLTRRGD
jgi:ElaB/YqjD/DUF883 family membrane-anchored ribosome-binding protein